MIKKIDHVVITTNNIDASCLFYQALGFQIEKTADRYAFFAGDFKINVHLKGSELQPHARNISVGSADLCFEITIPIAEFELFLLKQNLPFELGNVLRIGVKGMMQSIYLRDPDGNLLEFSSYE